MYIAWHLLLKKNVLNAFKTSIGCSFIAAIVNTVFGLIIAWTLVKYDFPGKKILDGFIELPFCLPTAVAGITLSRLYSEDGFLGKTLKALGIDVAYTKIGLTIALVFVGIPFVIRAVQPILEKMDNQYEEAAYMLGATPRRTFFKVILPELRPALLTGFGLGTGEVRLSGRTTARLMPSLVGTSCLPLRCTKPICTSFSRIAARVAGVPSPLRSAWPRPPSLAPAEQFTLSSGISSAPARSIANRSVSSV